MTPISETGETDISMEDGSGLAQFRKELQQRFFPEDKDDASSVSVESIPSDEEAVEIMIDNMLQVFNSYNFPAETKMKKCWLGEASASPVEKNAPQLAANNGPRTATDSEAPAYEATARSPSDCANCDDDSLPISPQKSGKLDNRSVVARKLRCYDGIYEAENGDIGSSGMKIHSLT